MGNEITTVNQTSLTRFTPQLTKLLEKVSEPTAAIVKARHDGLMFGEMNVNEITIAAGKIIADLSILTGIKTPTGLSFTQLTKFLIESLQETYAYYTSSLFKIGLKKYAHVLTTGENKSYGRTLSLADIEQVMDEYLAELIDANKEVDELLQQESAQVIIDENDKQNIIRKTIEEKYQKGNFDCTFADYNQLLRDKILNEDSIKKVAWTAILSLRNKYIAMSKSIGTDTDESIKGVLQKRNVQEKLQMLSAIEDEIKGEAATMFLQYCKQQGRQNIYIKD